MFTRASFWILGSREAVDKALSRYARAGTLRKLARGLYDLPRTHQRFGDLAASLRRNRRRAQGPGRHPPAADRRLCGERSRPVGPGAHATRVPHRRPSRRVTVGNREIVLKHTTPRNMATAGRASGLVIQALRWLRKENVDDKIVAKLRRNLKPEDKAPLLADAHLAPAWISAIFHQLAPGKG